MRVAKRFRVESESRPPDTVAIIGIITESDFKIAPASLEEFRDYYNYDDYLALRESLQLGLSTAGIVASAMYMSLSTLTLWRKFASKPESDGSPVAHDLWIGAIADLTIEG